MAYRTQFMTVTGKKFIAEASDLGIKPGDWVQTIDLLSDDNAVTEWVWERSITDSEGDLSAMVYVPSDQTLAEDYDWYGWQLHVVND